MAILAPFLSAFDPEVSQEGSVDPLSLQAFGERLAERVYPHITSRMSRVRFVTAMCVGAVVCEEFDGEMAADGLTPPWLVFEWYVVEALMRQLETLGPEEGWGRGVPGYRKVKHVIDRNQQLGTFSYLKTAKVFGFTGVYRRLAVGLRLSDDDLGLGSEAVRLLRAWEVDQKLEGFVDGVAEGGAFRDTLAAAVRDGLKSGHTNRSRSWDEWGRIAEVLRPDKARSRERKQLFELLTGNDGLPNTADAEAVSMRREIIQHIESRGALLSRQHEPQFFRGVTRKASRPLAIRLRAIDAYEAVCALLTDAFSRIRWISSEAGDRAVGEAEFVKDRECKAISRALPEAVERMEHALGELDCAQEIQELRNRYAGIKSADQLYRVLLDHHAEAQRNKPPDGKRSWVEEDDRGIRVRPAYRLETEPARTDGYVHDYRTSSCSSFLNDLKRLS